MGSPCMCLYVCLHFMRDSHVLLRVFCLVLQPPHEQHGLSDEHECRHAQQEPRTLTQQGEQVSVWLHTPTRE